VRFRGGRAEGERGRKDIGRSLRHRTLLLVHLQLELRREESLQALHHPFSGPPATNVDVTIVRVPRKPKPARSKRPDQRQHSPISDPFGDLRHQFVMIDPVEEFQSAPLMDMASRSHARSPGAVCLESGSCPSTRTFAPRFFQTLRRRNGLAFRSDLTFIRLSRGLSPPSCRTCSAHKKKGERGCLPPNSVLAAQIWKQQRLPDVTAWLS